MYLLNSRWKSRKDAKPAKFLFASFASLREMLFRRSAQYT